MASRRLDISSLLCADDPPKPPPSSQSQSPPLSEPVILAPHLRHHPHRLNTDLAHTGTTPIFPTREQERDKPLSTRRRTPLPEGPFPYLPPSSRRRSYTEYPVDQDDAEIDPPRSSHTAQSYDHINHQHQQRQRQVDLVHHQQRPSHSHQTEPQYPSGSRPASHSPTHPQSPTAPYLYSPPSQITMSPARSPASLYGPGRPPASTSPVLSTHRGTSLPLSHFPHPSRSQPPHPSLSHSLSPLQSLPNPSLSPISQPSPSSSHTHSRPPSSTAQPHLHSLPTIPQLHPHSYRPPMSPPLSSPAQLQFHPHPSGVPLPNHPYPPGSQTTLLPSRPSISPTLFKPFIGLEALVHAASEERRRLSGDETAEMDTAPLQLRHTSEEYPNPQSRTQEPQPQEHRVAEAIYKSIGVEDAERPFKRRRSSGSSGHFDIIGVSRASGSSGQEMERQAVAVEHHREESISPSKPNVRSGISVHDSIGCARIDPGVAGDKSWYSQSQKASDDPRLMPVQATLESDAMLPVLGGRVSPAVDVKKKRSNLRTRQPKDTGNSWGRVDDKPGARRDVGDRDEQDAHEWLLEHYANSPPATRKLPMPMHPSSDSQSRLPRQDRMPTPDLVSPLDHEPEEAVVVNHSARKTKSEPDVDFGLELITDNNHPPQGNVEVDVEDELLSLVDDRPRSAQPARAASPQPGRSYDTYSSKSSLARQVSLDPHPVTPVSLSSATPFVPSVSSSLPTPTPERGSMPPPASTTVTASKKGSAATGSKKKKDVGSKPAAAKPKAPHKPRAKPLPKVKDKEDDSKGPKSSLVPPAATNAASRKFAVGMARSRSTSAMPGVRSSIGPEGDKDKMDIDKDGEAETEDQDRDEDKLYCVCKTRYDEDRVMIACDRCDEWYHTQCVNMPDLEVDLVDQFICPVCIESNPHLSLHTTYKRRCLYGLKQTDPSSANACHKPARGAFSKYCSNECGIKYMQTRIDSWTKNGGKREKLWESVKGAEKREGVVVCAVDNVNENNGIVKMEVDKEPCRNEVAVAVLKKPKKTKIEREVERFNLQLEQVVKEREAMKKEMEVILWRERLVELATERAERMNECGWDQRLCFGDEEWIDFSAGVLESYEESSRAPSVQRDEADGAMQVDGAPAEDGEWWCRGKKKCERHSGWQKLRAAEVSYEKETKDSALSKLTTREREIRKHIEDIIDPQARVSAPPKMPLTSSESSNSRPNGHAKLNGDAAKKGKKRKSQVF